MDLAESRFIRKVVIKEWAAEVLRKIGPFPILWELFEVLERLLVFWLAVWKPIWMTERKIHCAHMSKVESETKWISVRPTNWFSEQKEFREKQAYTLSFPPQFCLFFFFFFTTLRLWQPAWKKIRQTAFQLSRKKPAWKPRVRKKPKQMRDWE
jgi:hypothetical protein